MPMADLPERILKHIYPEPNTGCWLWGFTTNEGGYGYVKHELRMQLAHRVVYESERGPIQSGLCLLHSCDTPACVNPDHLSPGTRRDNNLDARRKGRGFVLPPPPRHQPSDADRALVAELYKTMTGREIASHLGWSEKRVFRTLALRPGSKPREAKPLTPEQRATLSRLAATHSIKQLAALVGAGPAKIRQALKEVC